MHVFISIFLFFVNISNILIFRSKFIFWFPIFILEIIFIGLIFKWLFWIYFQLFNILDKFRVIVFSITLINLFSILLIIRLLFFYWCCLIRFLLFFLILVFFLFLAITLILFIFIIAIFLDTIYLIAFIILYFQNFLFLCFHVRILLVQTFLFILFNLLTSFPLFLLFCHLF